MLDVISENMASIVQLGKYGNINEEYPTTIGYYVINDYMKHTHYNNTKPNMVK